METIQVRTKEKQDFPEITGAVREKVRNRGWQDGVLFIFVPHTTAGIFINEHADPDVVKDISALADRIIPEEFPCRHTEGNSPAHAKSVLFNNSLYVIIEKGDLVLGTWQGIFLAEFDGPRNREVYLKFMTDGG
ncbi:MAG: secondary thiamine-phosphate synthase enzyme YjbQ [Candidatus Omnitrophica bacterium]|nr:secondary thiamine-phosphate synthase enzyme YjbQ [Candidatus Omnitrophota bacterium]